MTVRLLSLMSMIEAELPERHVGTTRTVNYGRGIGRLVLGDGSGHMLLKHFVLAGGQSCVRIEMKRPGITQYKESSIFPQERDFVWQHEAMRIAEEWQEFLSVLPARGDLNMAAEDTQEAGVAEATA